MEVELVPDLEAEVGFGFFVVFGVVDESGDAGFGSSGVDELLEQRVVVELDDVGAALGPLVEGVDFLRSYDRTATASFSLTRLRKA